MSTVMDTILGSSVCQRFLADHPEGWSAEDWSRFYGNLRELFGELDEEGLKEQILEEHLAQQRLRREAGAQREPRATMRTPTQTWRRKGLPLHIKVGLVLMLLLAVALLLLELVR